MSYKVTLYFQCPGCGKLTRPAPDNPGGRVRCRRCGWSPAGHHPAQGRTSV